MSDHGQTALKWQSRIQIVRNKVYFVIILMLIRSTQFHMNVGHCRKVSGISNDTRALQQEVGACGRKEQEEVRWSAESGNQMIKA